MTDAPDMALPKESATVTAGANDCPACGEAGGSVVNDSVVAAAGVMAKLLLFTAVKPVAVAWSA